MKPNQTLLKTGVVMLNPGTITDTVCCQTLHTTKTNLNNNDPGNDPATAGSLSFYTEPDLSTATTTVMRKVLSKYRVLAVAFVMANLLFVSGVFGQSDGDYRSKQDGTWSDRTDWQRFNGSIWTDPTVSEGYPGQNAIPSIVTIQNDHQMDFDVSPANSIGSLFIGSAVTNNPTDLDFTGAFTLSVTGNVTVLSNAGNNIKALLVDAGILNVGGNLLIGTGSQGGDQNNRISRLTITTGTVTVDGDLTLTPNSASADPLQVQIVMTGGAGTFNLKGGFTITNNRGSLTPGTTSTFNFNGSAAGQTIPIGVSSVNYNNLQINNTHASGATLGNNNISSTRVTGNLSVQSGTFSNGGFGITLAINKSFSVANGATFKLTATSSMAIVSGTGTKSFGITSTVEYAGTGPQTISAETYGHLKVSGTANIGGISVTSVGTTTVSGTLTFSSNTNTKIFKDIVISGTWDASGSGGENFAVNGNFQNDGTFTPGTGTYSFTGSSAQEIKGNNASTFDKLEVNNSNGVSLTGSVNTTVTTTLTFTSGKISTNANKLIVGNAGSAGTITGAGTGKYVFGNLRRFVQNASAPTVDYPIGDATNYTPASITFVGTTTGSGFLDASTSAIDPVFGPMPNGSGLSNTKYIKRRWVVANTGVSGFTSYSPTFTFVAGDIQGSANTSALLIRKLDGSTWTSTTGNTSTITTTKCTGLTSFSEFASGEDCSTAAPTGNASQTFCSSPSATVADLVATGTSIKWYDAATGGNLLSGATALVNGTHYYASQTPAGGCESNTRLDVTVTINVAVDFGTVDSGDETICYNGNPASITFSSAPSGGAGTFDYQWYYKDGINDCPTGTDVTGWTAISFGDGGTASSYDPPSGLTISRTYAVTVDPTGSPDCGVSTWANSCRKVTVNTAPSLSCPSNVSITTSLDGPGNCSTEYSWAHPDDNTNCSTTLTVTYTAGVPAPSVLPTGGTVTPGGAASATFYKGVTIVSYDVIDAEGNVANCSFNVTVTDDEDPTIECPIDLETGSDPGICGSVVIDIAPVSFGDNCPGSTITYTITGATSGSGVDDASGITFNVGESTITYTITDASGNIVTCDFTVTVIDVEDPTASNPAPLAFQCIANVPAPDVTVVTDEADNCTAVPIITFVGDVNNGGAGCVGDPYIVTRTYNVADEYGNNINVIQTITVIDNTNPTASNPAPVGVQCIANIPAADPSVVTDEADNCDPTPAVTLFSESNNGGAGCVGNPYIVTRVYRVTDDCGNFFDVTQTLTAIDNTAPTFVGALPGGAVGNVCKANAPAAPSTATIAAQYTDNCSAVTATLIGSTVTGTDCGWTATYTYSIRDACSNYAANAIVVYTGSDTQAPVITFCPPAQSFCKVPSNTYTIPALTATDNCSSVTVSYSITGATTRSGAGNNASGTFNLGVSTINWTVTDACSNTSVCSTSVTVHALPTVTITASSPDNFCYNLTLTANASPAGSYTYAWSWSPGGSATTQSIMLNNSYPDGLYSVVVSDGFGCSNSLPATYNYQKQNLINSYTIVGLKEVKLGELNNVQKGSVGATSATGKITVGKYSSIASPGAFAKAKTISVDPTANVPVKIFLPATVTLPTMQFNTSSTAGLPDVTVPANTTVILTGNYKDVKIKKGATVTLTGTIFGKVSLDEGAKATFTSAVVNMEDLDMAKGKDSGPGPGTFTIVDFSSGITAVRVLSKVNVGERCRVNPSNVNVVFYLGDNKPDQEKFTVAGKNTIVNSSIYIPIGELKVNGNKDENCYMTGLFIAEKVTSTDKNIIWNPFDCTAPPLTIVTTKVTEEINIPVPNRMEILAYPNPAEMFFNLKIKTSSKELVTIRVFDMTGRAVQLKSGSPGDIFRLGDGLVNGTYVIEVRQGKEIATVRVIKAN